MTFKLNAANRLRATEVFGNAAELAKKIFPKAKQVYGTWTYRQAFKDSVGSRAALEKIDTAALKEGFVRDTKGKYSGGVRVYHHKNGLTLHVEVKGVGTKQEVTAELK